MKKRIWITGIVVIVAVLGGTHWYYSDRGRFTTPAEYTDLRRSVAGNDLVSRQDPDAILRFDSSFRALGGQKFILYGVADTEQYFFVETTDDDVLKSVFWIQYEAYLPDKSYTYDYDDSPYRVMLGEYEFYTDTDVVVDYDPYKKRRQGTDGARAREFLASKGYTYPKDWAYARLVYLTDESRQKELMIIYIDDLSRHGITAEQIKSDQSQDGPRHAAEQAHLERIKQVLTVLPLNSNS